MADSQRPTNSGGPSSPDPSGPAGPPGPPGVEQWRYWVWLGVLGLFFAYAFWAGGQATRSVDLSYTAFKQEVRAGTVAEVTVSGADITGRFREGEGPETVAETPRGPQGEPPQRFTTVRPGFDDNLMALLEDNGVTVHAVPERDAWWAPLLMGLLPLVLILVLLYYSGKRMQDQLGGLGGRMGGFGQSQAKRYDKSTSSVTFNEVAGAENAKRDLQEIVEYLKDPARFQKLGAQIPRGVLLMGAPGTGKTLLARAVAGEADVPFFSVSGSQFVEMFVGVGASRVRDMFKDAKQEAPAIIFIDEIDAVGRSRGAGLGGGHDEREQTLNQILAEMDGFDPHESVVVMAATNRPDVLDSALLRPGRFDRKVTLERPQRKAREEILRVHTRDVPLAEGVDLADIAARTVGFSGADLENLVNEAALFAGRKGKEAVDGEDFDDARDKIIFGGEREMVLTEADKERIAYHESGHTILARLLPNTDPLRKVTIIPRGQALGATEQVPDEDRYNYTTGYLRDRLAVMLGGRAAECTRFEEVSTGAQDDLKQATRLARQMITQWGMSDKVGPVHFRQGEEHVFLGREMGQPQDYSDDTARLIDQEVHDLLVEQERRAREVLADNRPGLEALAAALMERETLEAEEVDEVLGLSGEGKPEAGGEAVGGTARSDPPGEEGL